jgi:hypothetical protein
MKRSSAVLALGLCGFLSIAGPAQADSNNLPKVNDRIQALRDRLDAFRSRGTTGGAATMEKSGNTDVNTPGKPDENLSPQELSEELEHRRDAKVIILFSDSIAPAAKSFRRESAGTPKVDQIKEKPELRKSPPKKVQEFWKNLLGSA